MKLNKIIFYRKACASFFIIGMAAFSPMSEINRSYSHINKPSVRKENRTVEEKNYSTVNVLCTIDNDEKPSIAFTRDFEIFKDKDWEDIKTAYKREWRNGYSVLDIERFQGSYWVVFEKNRENVISQVITLSRSWSEFWRNNRSCWDNGYKIHNVEEIGDCFIGIYHKLQNNYTQKAYGFRTLKQLFDKKNDLFDSGKYYLHDIEKINGLYFGVFNKSNNDVNYSGLHWGNRASFKSKMQSLSNKNIRLIDFEKFDDLYVGVFLRDNRKIGNQSWVQRGRLDRYSIALGVAIRSSSYKIVDLENINAQLPYVYVIDEKYIPRPRPVRRPSSLPDSTSPPPPPPPPPGCTECPCKIMRNRDGKVVMVDSGNAARCLEGDNGLGTYSCMNGKFKFERRSNSCRPSETWTPIN